MSFFVHIAHLMIKKYDVYCFYIATEYRNKQEYRQKLLIGFFARQCLYCITNPVCNINSNQISFSNNLIFFGFKLLLDIGFVKSSMPGIFYITATTEIHITEKSLNYNKEKL